MTCSELALERLLTEAHAASGPTPSERLRALERLELTIGAPPVATLQEAGVQEMGSQNASVRPLQHGSNAPAEAPSVQPGASVAALSATKWGALLVLALALGAVIHSERGRELPAGKAAAAPASSATVAVVPRAVTFEPEAASVGPVRAEQKQELPEARGLRSPTPAAPGSVSGARSHRAATASLEPKPAIPSAPDLREALRLLREAQRALRRQEGGKALSLLDELARRAPDALVEEREVTRVLAWCASGDDAAARRAASSVRESWPASPYAHRLSQSCVGAESSPHGLEEMQPRAPE